MSLGAVTKSLCQMMISCRKDPSIDYPFEIEAYIEVGVYSKPTSHRMSVGYCSTHLDGQAADTPLSNSPLVSSCARILRSYSACGSVCLAWLVLAQDWFV